MPNFTFNQPVRQLEKRKGGYYYFKIDKDIVKQFEKQRATRLLCTLDDSISYSCGLNHFGDGNFFIILSTANLKKLGKQLGDTVLFEIIEDPNPLPLGVEVPEVLTVLLAQDPQAKAVYEKLTDGKKRSLIYSIKGIKDIDKQVKRILAFLEEQGAKFR
ncbi:YdeI/OmpD-associated family protein [Poritiphilus flavus]|uniref:DUF1905 domain-containing protein n=1 Tax=Poritiphilus flavus TaxID=2697053 RepID=A0A6L9EH06_9FLAO|nr:YdeI/OmpD-associated family protein [Poritiphilus flavus]NAS13971.1 DUF1905 domain-containing protein [Poritiphilus flavus]